jgi:hypothetical protein
MRCNGLLLAATFQEEKGLGLESRERFLPATLGLKISCRDIY